MQGCGKSRIRRRQELYPSGGEANSLSLFNQLQTQHAELLMA
jgi:hypothetical protein